MELTREEVPHSVAVVVDRIKRRDEEKILIQATIIVERASQKGIIIGKGGKMLKTIGVKARKDIELMMGDKVYLELWVKVMPNWKDRQIDLRSLGYKQDDYVSAPLFLRRNYRGFASGRRVFRHRGFKKRL